MKEDAVVITSKSGKRLFGILHTNGQDANPAGIVLLSPGIKNRVAPHRLYIKMARRFAEMGFTVLRFDPEGLGDSEGDITEPLTADLYRSIQTGRFVDDTISAMDWMDRECGTKKYILSGLCGGAITGLLAGALDRRVDSLLGLGIPVVLDGSEVDERKNITEARLEALRKRYFRRLLDPKAWSRFLSFRSDYRLIMKSLLQAAGKNKKNAPDTHVLSDAVFNHIPGSNYNPYFTPAFYRMVSSSRRLFLIFSEADRLYWEFDEKFARWFGEDLKKYASFYEVSIVKNANHIFSLKETQEEMLALSSDWLKRNYKRS